MYTCTNILYDIRILRDCFILQRRQVILLQSFPHDNEVLAPGLCQTVLWRKHAFCSLSHISIHDQKCCYNTSENQENTAVDTVGHHSILCILHPAGLKHTIKIQLSWTAWNLVTHVYVWYSQQVKDQKYSVLLECRLRKYSNFLEVN